MTEMTAKELTEYLQYAAELESSVYRQEMTIQQANNDLQFPYPNEKYISKPSNAADRMTKPTPPVLKHTGKFLYYFFFFIGLLWTVIFGIELIPFLLLEFSFTILILWAIPFLMSLAIALHYKGKYDIDKMIDTKRSQEYNRDLEEYDKALDAANQKYQEDLVLYRKECEAAQEEYNKAYAIAVQNFAIAKEAVSQLDLPFKETKEALQQLYSKDIIFPKYRNMVAMCTMYEYFVTGRCTELGGPDGAYNMYETELRQNLIINHLDTIVDNLENIKQNQYTLYQEMCKTNNIMSGISSDIEDILSGTREIAYAANINAHCAQSIAKNTEALKYITLING